MLDLFGLYFNFWVLLFLAGLGFASFLFYSYFSTRQKLYFSNLQDFSGTSRLPFLPELFFILSLLLFGLAALSPHYFVEKSAGENSNTPTEGIAIYLVLDKSGSMAEESSSRTQTKLELMKQLTETFVQARPSDLIGLVSFARQADVMVPLTLDHASVEQALQEMAQIDDRTMDGTAIGYAIYKTASLIDSAQTYNKEKGAYDIKNSIIVLVTDGLQDPNPLDQGNRLRTIGLDEAAAYAKGKGVKLYIINVEPKLATERYAAQRRQLERITHETGGRFYIVDSPRALEKVYSDINQIEKSFIPNATKENLPQYFTRRNLYPALISLGLICFLVGVILQTVVLRRVP